MSNLSNMDNYIRILCLLFETAPYALGKLMLQYLNRTKITLPDLINIHQHEIYHHFTDKKCCICTTTPSRCRFVIMKEQLMELFDTSPNAKRLTGHNLGSLQRSMCCCMAKPIVVENLDFTLLTFLIINFCEDEFWICFLEKYENDFEKFLSDEKHKLFHLWKLNAVCCECRAGYSCSDESIIDMHQFREMYIKIPSKCCNEDACHYKPKRGLTFKELKRRDKVLFTSLTNHFCNVRKAIEAISNIRNSRIANVKSMDMSKNEFESLWKLMEDSLLEIATSTQSETEITQRIEQCATRDLDIGMGQRWVRELLPDQDLKQMILERLKKAKEYHDGIQRIPTAFDKFCVSITEEKQHIKEGLELEYISSLSESETDEEDIQDSYRCGGCGETYATLDLFVNHKIVCKSKKKTTEYGKPNSFSKDVHTKQASMVFHATHDVVRRLNQIQSQKLSSESIITELAEEGTSSIMKKKESFMKEVDDFVYKLTDKCPVAIDEKTTLTVKIDAIEDLECYEDDEDDVFKCGRCLKEFHSAAFLCSHKRKCNKIRNRRSTTQRISSGNIEDLEGYEDDEDDVFKCGRCLKEFHSAAFLCSHKRKCNKIRNRRSTTQRISSGNIEDLEGYGDDEDDVFKCGRCLKEFHSAAFLCSHKRKCNKIRNRRSTTQRIYSGNIEDLEGYEDDDDDVFECGRCLKELHSFALFFSHTRTCNKKIHDRRSTTQWISSGNKQTIIQEDIPLDSDRTTMPLCLADDVVRQQEWTSITDNVVSGTIMSACPVDTDVVGPQEQTSVSDLVTNRRTMSIGPVEDVEWPQEQTSSTHSVTNETDYMSRVMLPTATREYNVGEQKYMDKVYTMGMLSNTNEIEWFYKLDLKCDDNNIHCIVDRRLERKYVSLSSVYKHEPYGQHLLVDNPLKMTVNQLNQSKQSEFEQLYTIKSTVSDRTQLNLRHALVDASRQQFSILCRWLMANIHSWGVTNKEMESALDTAFKNLDKDTAKAISWCITKTFYKRFQVYLSHCFDVYPGLRCQCLNKGQNINTLCSNEKLIIITAGTEVKGLPAEYKGFKIKIMDGHGKSTEKSESETLSALLAQNYTDSYHIKVNISNTTAKKLFDSHSNLALICPSVHRSFSFARKHEVKNELCIQLYCKLKGILPLGEIHFPDSIHGIPTDVIDGEACFISKLRIGDTIGQQYSTGSLGGFVQYLDFECFLTCAHVMYDVQTLLGSSSNFAQLPGAKAYNHTVHGVLECGKVIWKTFDHDDKLKTSIDAALVFLQNNWTMDPSDYILDGDGNSCPFSKLGLSSPYLNSNFLDHEEFCVSQQTATAVGAGSMTQLECNVTFPKQTEVEINFSNIGQAAGSANGNAFCPLLMHTPAHMQLTTGYLTDKRVFCMYNQIVINLGLRPGDSGTCIYIVQHPKKNGCIGMAIAFCGGLTIVTPLKDILKRMNT